MTIPLTGTRIHEVRLANDDLFWRYPRRLGMITELMSYYPL